MAHKKIIQTLDAPAAIGTYSQAVSIGDTVYLSGQIGLDPITMQLVDGIEAQIHRVFRNLRAVASAADSSFDDMVKLNVYLTDLANFTKVNEIMATYFRQPYPPALRWAWQPCRAARWWRWTGCWWFRIKNNSFPIEGKVRMGVEKSGWG